MFEQVLKKYTSEVFVSDLVVAEVAFDNDINASRLVSEKGYNIRTLSDQRLGSAHSNIFTKKNIDAAAANSVAAGKYTKPLPKEFSFTGKKGRTPVSGTFDKETSKNLEERAICMAEDALAAAHEKKIHITDGRARATFFKYTIQNSNGIEKQEQGTYVTASMETKAITEKPLAEVSMQFAAREYDKKKYLDWLQEKMRMVSAFVEPKKIRTGKYDILLSPKVFGSLLLDTVGFWASGKARLDGTGAFKKQGERVASENFSASMDGRLDEAMASFSVDAEGNKTTKKQLVEKGIFKDYFYEQKYASYFNESSDGCALRTSLLGPEKLYTSSPYCGAHNLVVEPGKEKLEDILSDMKGIFVENAGIATADSETGTFGFELRNAFIVDKGVLTPARYAVFSGTVQNLLKNVVLTKETQQASEDGGAEFSSACICPHAFVEKQELAGASNKQS